MRELICRYHNEVVGILPFCSLNSCRIRVAPQSRYYNTAWRYMYVCFSGERGLQLSRFPKDSLSLKRSVRTTNLEWRARHTFEERIWRPCYLFYSLKNDHGMATCKPRQVGIANIPGRSVPPVCLFWNEKNNVSGLVEHLHLELTRCCALALGSSGFFLYSQLPSMRQMRNSWENVWMIEWRL